MILIYLFIHLISRNARFSDTRISNFYFILCYSRAFVRKYCVHMHFESLISFFSQRLLLLSIGRALTRIWRAVPRVNR